VNKKRWGGIRETLVGVSNSQIADVTVLSFVKTPDEDTKKVNPHKKTLKGEGLRVKKGKLSIKMILLSRGQGREKGICGTRPTVGTNVAVPSAVAGEIKVP